MKHPSRYSLSQLQILIPAIITTLTILGLFTYWFGFADRSLLFLVDHDMGPRFPDTSAFSRVTVSRYWIAGLLASGYVFVAWSLFNLLMPLVRKGYSPPAWWTIYVLCAPFLLAGSLLIPMTLGTPHLPFIHAVKVMTATLAGTAVALMAGNLAAGGFRKFLLLGIDGMAVGLILNLAIWVVDRRGELAGWTEVLSGYLLVLFVTVLISTYFYVSLKLKAKTGEMMALYFASFYLFGVLFHHLAGTNGHFYVSSSDNFFSNSLPLQLISWAAAWLVFYAQIQVGAGLIERKKDKKMNPE
ncbi:MAG: hypothetical protein ACOYXB_14515 [Bacteroidota bacterium]